MTMLLAPISLLLYFSPFTIATGTAESFPIASSAALAISSTIAGSVTRRVYPYASTFPLYDWSGSIPEEPIATSVCPLRQGRPKVSVITTESLAPTPLSRDLLILLALLSGLRGRRAAWPLSTFDLSIPAFAQTKPCLVSVIITPWPIRTILLDSRRINSTSCGSFPSSPASRTARLDGFTPSSLTTLPSAFETIFCLTTTTSFSFSDSPADPRAPIISPAILSSFLTSGIPRRGWTEYKCDYRGPNPALLFMMTPSAAHLFLSSTRKRPRNRRILGGLAVARAFSQRCSLNLYSSFIISLCFCAESLLKEGASSDSEMVRRGCRRCHRCF